MDLGAKKCELLRWPWLLPILVGYLDKSLAQKSPPFLAPGTSFMEDNSSMDGDEVGLVGVGWCGDDSSALHLLYFYYFYYYISFISIITSASP